MKFIVSLILIFCTNFLFSKEIVVIQSPQTAKASFQAYLQTENVISYAEKQLQDIRQKNQMEESNLQFLLEQAQEAFLKSHLNHAGEIFQSITQKAYHYDWSQESQKIIFYSFLRLAQIEWKTESAEVYLHSAILFAPHQIPDAKLFPPPLIQKFHSLKSRLPKLLIDWGRIFSLYEVILLNGRVLSAQQSIELPYGEYRITAISSSYEKWSRKRVNLSWLVKKKIITPSFVHGDCEQPIMKNFIKSYHVLFPDSCLWQSKKEFTHAQAENLKIPRYKINQKSPLKISSPMLNPVQSSHQPLFRQQKFWKYSAITLLGTSILAGFLWWTLSDHTSNKDSKNPSTQIVIGF